MGSVRFVVDERGNITSEHTYSSFGRMLDFKGAGAEIFGFDGESWDEDAELLYLRSDIMIRTLGDSSVPILLGVTFPIRAVSTVTVTPRMTPSTVVTHPDSRTIGEEVLVSMLR
jgi:hypothetical protein